MFNLERLERIVLSVAVIVIFTAGVFIFFCKTCMPSSITVYRPPHIPTNSSGQGAGVTLRKVNINTAPPKELMRLKGVGNAIAGRIVDYRTRTGLFLSPGDICKVKGVGKGIYEKNKDAIVVD